MYVRLSWGQKVPAWLGGNNKDKTRGPSIHMRERGQLHSVFFVVLNVMQIRRVFRMKTA